jgi:hypothetical protein
VWLGSPLCAVNALSTGRKSDEMLCLLNEFGPWRNRCCLGLLTKFNFMGEAPNKDRVSDIYGMMGTNKTFTSFTVRYPAEH